MATIQIVIEPQLLAAADAAAKHERINRSALMRRALQLHLNQLREAQLVAREIQAYQKNQPPPDDDLIPEEDAAWPED